MWFSCTIMCVWPNEVWLVCGLYCCICKLYSHTNSRQCIGCNPKNNNLQLRRASARQRVPITLPGHMLARAANTGCTMSNTGAHVDQQTKAAHAQPYKKQTQTNTHTDTHRDNDTEIYRDTYTDTHLETGSVGHIPCILQVFSLKQTSGHRTPTPGQCMFTA